MNIPSNVLTLIAGVALTLVSLWYGQNHGLMPVAASEQAKQVDDIFNLMMTIATGLFFLIQGVLIFCAIKFRRKKDDYTDAAPIEGNVPLEILWTAVPTVIVFILAIYSFEIYNNMGGLDPMASMDHSSHKMAHHQHEPNLGDNTLVAMNPNQQVALGLGAEPGNQGNKPSVVVNAQGMQYAWIFNYPNEGVYSGEMHVPVGQDVQVKIQALDVLHAFWLPEFRIKQDAIPGREVELNFTPTLVGEYPIICAELCGSYHGAMKAMLYVDTEEDYQQWIRDNTFAQADMQKAVALNPMEMSQTEFLTPYAEEMGATPDALAHIGHHH